MFDFVFPRRPDASRVPGGILGDTRFEKWALVGAVLIAAAVAAFLELVMNQLPVPPGGDPGQWLTTSYAYVGLPYPNWIIPGQYPPLTFPILGVLVRASGGPILAARAYVALVTGLIGLSSYFWARAVIRTWTVALLVEGFLLVNPSFIQLYFFGAYPNLLGFVFLFLTIGFAVRFIRSRDPHHAFWMWLALGATVLTHSLVAAVLVTTVAILAVFLFALRRVPRAIVTGRPSQVGFAIMGVSIGGYYALTQYLGISHPQYLAAGGFAYVKNGLGAIFSLVLDPIFPNLTFPASIALEFLIGLDAFLLIALATMAILRLRAFSLSNLVALGSLLAVGLLAVVGWELSIVTDYVRLGYFLVPPAILIIGLAIDWAVRELRRYSGADAEDAVDRPPVATVPAPGTNGPVRPPARRAFPAPAVLVVLLLGLAAMLLLAAVLTVPAVRLYEANDTTVAHDAQFLGAVSLMRSSGVHGAVLTVPGAVKWTRALLATNSYGPFIPGHYSFDPDHILDSELAYFAMTDRYAVTNNLVAFSVAGTNSTFLETSPTYQASYFGLFTPILRLLPQSVNVTVANGTSTETLGVDVAPEIILPPQGGSTMSLLYNEPAFQLEITTTALPGAALARITVQATATGSGLLQQLRANLTNNVVGTASVAAGKAIGQFTWSPSAFGSALRTYGNVTPASSVFRVSNNYGTNFGPRVYVKVPAPAAGAAILSFSVLLSTPGAQNLIATLPPIISTTSVWASWNARFVLFGNNSVPAQLQRGVLATTPTYLEDEFGARVIGYSGIWTVLLLPVETG